MAASDAATVGQMMAGDASTLQAANAYTDNALGGVFGQLDTLFELVSRGNRINRREIDSAASSSAALAGLPQAMVPGKSFVAASIGGRGEQVSLAMGLGYVFDENHLPVIRAGVAIDTRTGRGSYNLSAGLHF